MRVYKFISAHWGLEALEKRRLKVSPIDELNDPFEYLNVDIGDRSVRSFIKEKRKFLGLNGAIISFSSQWSNPVIWSHYADSHQGIALGFDVPDKILYKINYTDKKIKLDADDLDRPDVLKKIFETVGKTKFEHWKYESEYRLFYDLTRSKNEKSDDDNGMFFQPFEDDLKLREVILGCRYKSSEREALETSLRRDGVLFVTARPAFSGFKMIEQSCRKLQKRL